MPRHLIFFLFERWCFKPLMLKTLCHPLQNMYQCYFGAAKGVIRVSAVVHEGHPRAVHVDQARRNAEQGDVLRNQEWLEVCLPKLSFDVFQVFHSPTMTVAFIHFLLLFL